MIPINCSCPGLGLYARACPTHGADTDCFEWAVEAGDLLSWPTRQNPCYDCGSRLPGHHTLLCDFAAPGDARDLPCRAGTQHWNGMEPQPLDLDTGGALCAGA